MTTCAGVASIDITPTCPVMQGGFGQRTVPSIGVLDPLSAKALYLASDSGTVLMITADLIAIPKQIAREVVATLVAVDGLEAHEVCLCASHTHSGPVPFGPGVPGVDAYSVQLVDALVAVARAAIAAPVECSVGVGVGSAPIGFNRRTRRDPDLVDHRVAVLVVREAASEVAGTAPLAVLFGVGCHPVTLGWDNQQISGDFPGVAQRAVEAALPGTTALFFNSTEANIIPITSPNRDALDPRGYVGGTRADTDMIGRIVADEVIRVVAQIEPVAGASIAAARREIPVETSTASFDLEAATERLAAARAVLARRLGPDFETVAAGNLWALASRYVVTTDCSEDEMRVVMVACCEYLVWAARVGFGRALDPVSVPIQVLRMGDLELLALPGEPLVEVGQAWSARAGSDRAFVVGLANAHHRYLPLRQHFDLPSASVQYDTLTAGLEPNGVDRLLDEAEELLADVRATA